MPGAGAGEVTVIVPLAIVQFGWLGTATGCVGTGGGALTVTFSAGEIQP